MQELPEHASTGKVAYSCSGAGKKNTTNNNATKKKKNHHEAHGRSVGKLDEAGVRVRVRGARGGSVLYLNDF